MAGIVLAFWVLGATSALADSTVVDAKLVSGTGNPAGMSIVWSPDGRRLLYLMDPAGDHGLELFSVASTGGTPVRLSAEMPLGDWATAYLVTPDSRSVLFVAPNEVAGTYELYAVPIGGPAAAAVRLHAPMPLGKKVANQLTLTPDARRVLFLADLEGSGHLELWIAPIDGAQAAIRLSSGAMVAGGNVEAVKVSPDGATAVFRADAAVDGRPELWSVPIDGSAAPVRLNPPLGFGSKVTTFEITSGGRVIYLADPTAGRQELWASPLAGPGAAAIRLNASATTYGKVIGFALVYDDRRVVYRAGPNANGVYRLYRVSVDGSPAATQISTGMQANGSVTRWAVTPDRSSVVYVGDGVSDEVYALWSIDQDPLGSPVSIGSSPFVGADVEDFCIAADSRRVAYTVNTSINGVTNLHAVDVGGGSTVKLAQLSSQLSNYPASISSTSDGQRVVIRWRIPDTTGAGFYAWTRMDGSDASPVSLHPSWEGSAAGGVSSPDGQSFAWREGDSVYQRSLWLSRLK